MKIYNNVSTSQLSIARYYGGMKINGLEYKYDHANDALIYVKDVKQYKKQMFKKPPKWTP